MSSPVAKDRYFEVSEDGLHLLRNGFNHKTHPLSKIDLVELKRGKSISNWGVILGLGLILIAGAIYLVIGIVHFFMSDEPGRIEAMVILAPVMMFLFGGYCLYLGLKTEEIISFKLNKKEERFATKSLKNSEQLEGLIGFLKEKNIRVKA